MGRNQKVLAKIPPNSKILEIGPSIGPIAPKAEGWRSFSIDCEDREGLIKKYRDQNVDTSRIEEVDFVWRQGPIYEAVSADHHQTFDACIASHVIEHLPNPIGYFRSLERLLKADGVISLVVPDKRFCFDYFKPWTTTADWLYANHQDRSRHSKKSAFEMEAYSVNHKSECAWGQHPVERLSFYVSLADAKKAFDERRDDPESPYADQHAWYFTPSSFQLLVLELNTLSEIDFVIDTSFPTVGCEFFVTLRRGRLPATDQDGLNEQRLNLLKGIIREQKEQYDYLCGGSAVGASDTSNASEPKMPANGADALTSIVQRLDHLAGAMIRSDEELRATLDEQGRQLRKITAAIRAGKKILAPLRAARRGLGRIVDRSGAARK